MNTYWFMSLFKFSPFCPVEEWNIEITKQVAVAITEHGKPVNTRLCHTVGENYQPHSEILRDWKLSKWTLCACSKCWEHNQTCFPFSTQKSWLFLSYIWLFHVRANNNKNLYTDFLVLFYFYKTQKSINMFTSIRCSSMGWIKSTKGQR